MATAGLSDSRSFYCYFLLASSALIFDETDSGLLAFSRGRFISSDPIFALSSDLIYSSSWLPLSLRLPLMLYLPSRITVGESRSAAEDYPPFSVLEGDTCSYNS